MSEILIDTKEFKTKIDTEEKYCETNLKKEGKKVEEYDMYLKKIELLNECIDDWKNVISKLEDKMKELDDEEKINGIQTHIWDIQHSIDELRVEARILAVLENPDLEVLELIENRLRGDGFYTPDDNLGDLIYLALSRFSGNHSVTRLGGWGTGY